MDDDRNSRFRFGTAWRTARPREPLLAVLARSGAWPHLVRSIRYHRPRGPFCGTGACVGCLVRVNGRPNVRACRYRPSEGDRVACENSWPGPTFDVFGAVDFLFPNGIDTTRGLRRPAFAARFYQRLVRRLAGYGRPPDVAYRAPDPSPSVLEAPAVIVGAGPAGRQVATGLAAGGVRPLVLERDDDGAPLASADLLGGVTATVLSATPDGAHRFSLLAFSETGRAYAVRASNVIVATGGYDAGLLFEGSDKPGVISADLALRFPELRLGFAVVVGGRDRALQLVDRIGPNVRAVVAPGDIQPDLVARAAELKIPLYPRSRVVRAHGRARVRSLDLASRGDAGRFSLACRTVVLAHRRLPNAQLFFQVGAARTYRRDPGAYYPEVEADGRTSVAGLWGVGGAARPASDGFVDVQKTVDAILGRSPPAPSATARPRGADPWTPYFRELRAERRHGKWVVCPCEDVLLDEVEEAVRRGFRGLEVVKRYTGVGTGLCQGRFCLPDVLPILAGLEARAPEDVGTITQRPPLVPTSLGALAGLGDVVPEEAPR